MILACLARASQGRPGGAKVARFSLAFRNFASKMWFIPALQVRFLTPTISGRPWGSRNAHKEFHMLRRMLSASAVLFVLAGFVFAETYQGLITKIEKDEIKITVRKKGEKKGEEKTFKVSKDLKISKKGKNKDDDPTDVSVSDFTKAVEKAASGEGKQKGVGATIETDGEGDKETVTKITYGGGGKRKNKDK